MEPPPVIQRRSGTRRGLAECILMEMRGPRGPALPRAKGPAAPDYNVTPFHIIHNRPRIRPQAHILAAAS